LIIVYAAAINLKITYQIMKKWIQKKDKILEQKKGSWRRIGGYLQKGKEHKIKVELIKLFKLAKQARRTIKA